MSGVDSPVGRKQDKKMTQPRNTIFSRGSITRNDLLRELAVDDNEKVTLNDIEVYINKTKQKEHDLAWYKFTVIFGFFLLVLQSCVTFGVVIWSDGVTRQLYTQDTTMTNADGQPIDATGFESKELTHQVIYKALDDGDRISHLEGSAVSKADGGTVGYSINIVASLRKGNEFMLYTDNPNTTIRVTEDNMVLKIDDEEYEPEAEGGGGDRRRLLPRGVYQNARIRVSPSRGPAPQKRSWGTLVGQGAITSNDLEVMRYYHGRIYGTDENRRVYYWNGSRWAKDIRMSYMYLLRFPEPTQQQLQSAGVIEAWEAASYGYMNGCIDGAKEIRQWNRFECRFAARQLGAQWRAEADWDSEPRGCFRIDVPGQAPKVFFNERKDPKHPREDRTSVCRLPASEERVSTFGLGPLKMSNQDSIRAIGSNNNNNRVQHYDGEHVKYWNGDLQHWAPIGRCLPAEGETGGLGSGGAANACANRLVNGAALATTSVVYGDDYTVGMKATCECVDTKCWQRNMHHPADPGQAFYSAYLAVAVGGLVNGDVTCVFLPSNHPALHAEWEALPTAEAFHLKTLTGTPGLEYDESCDANSSCPVPTGAYKFNNGPNCGAGNTISWGNECSAAAEFLGVTWAYELDSVNAQYGCYKAKNNKVYFNKNDKTTVVDSTSGTKFLCRTTAGTAARHPTTGLGPLKWKHNVHISGNSVQYYDGQDVRYWSSDVQEWRYSSECVSQSGGAGDETTCGNRSSDTAATGAWSGGMATCMMQQLSTGQGELLCEDPFEALVGCCMLMSSDKRGNDDCTDYVTKLTGGIGDLFDTRNVQCVFIPSSHPRLHDDWTKQPNARTDQLKLETGSPGLQYE